MDNDFLVPVYQRNYAWQDNEVIDFWRDLTDVAEGKRNSHFFGQIVTYKNSEGTQEIIDGQQRITTSSIFLAVMRDLSIQIRKDNEGNIPPEVNDDLRDIVRLVKDYLRGEDGDAPSLIVEQGTSEKQQLEIQSYFLKLIHKNSSQFKTMPLSAKNDVINNLLNAYSSIKGSLRLKLKEFNTITEQVQFLNKLFESFTKRFYVVMISAPSQQDAFIIFETLNSRGRDLTASDIIKNHLLYLLKDNIGKASDDWKKIYERLGSSSSTITRFIRTYWAARKRLVAESALYRSLSQIIDDPDAAKVFIEDLKELDDLYDVLDSPLSPKANREFFKNHMLRQKIDILHKMKVKLYYPIILSLYKRHYSEDDILKVVNKIISIFVRHRTIAFDGTNKLESGFADVAQKIYSGRIGNIEDILKEMDSKMLKTDKEVSSAFEALSKTGGQKGAKKWTLAYLLSEIYQANGTESTYEKVFEKDSYQLVHINSNSISEDHIDLIGNWTLLEKSLEYDESDSIEVCSKQLAKSELSVNKQLAHFVMINNWSENDIEKRQTEMASDALGIWW